MRRKKRFAISGAFGHPTGVGRSNRAILLPDHLQPFRLATREQWHKVDLKGFARVGSLGMYPQNMKLSLEFRSLSSSEKSGCSPGAALQMKFSLERVSRRSGSNIKMSCRLIGFSERDLGTDVNAT
ncbi:Hypothetical protein FKW44_004949 [Caligus rogercresseyi]|uniref:Uncharacterized protein n=1 Tax=Caligus rogercresseyi TaxID=217165 RepID=A0A7T8HMN3_CALRO|nr:Hypothetical protein FKW44_004949 [Caligus rogercresseyi]